MLNFILLWIFIIETSKTRMMQIEYFACLVTAPDLQTCFNGKHIPTSVLGRFMYLNNQALIFACSYVHVYIFFTQPL